MTEVPSPCINICDLDESSAYCLGCGRSLDEIAAWGSASDDERLAILANLSERSAMLNDGTEPIRIRARIDLLTTEQGGRASALNGNYNYRPNHNFGDAENRDMSIGQINFPEEKMFEPGESFEAEIIFIAIADIAPPIVPGLEWRIQEGAKLVAIGTVLEVLG